MLYPVNEIFYSVQGEGYHSGKPAIFIRLAGCNLKCPFCDTDFSEKEKIDEKDIVNKISASLVQINYPPLIVITGGEPTIYNLIPLLKELEMRTSSIVTIETNGTNPKQLNQLIIFKLIDWITVSPKFYSNSVIESMSIADEIKIVLDKTNPLNYIKYIKPELFDKGLVFIQPCSEDFQPALSFVLNNPKWRLSIQTQKILKVR
jgi:7-carboxy-7-deazaguanine synthase